MESIHHTYVLLFYRTHCSQKIKWDKKDILQEQTQRKTSTNLKRIHIHNKMTLDGDTLKAKLTVRTQRAADEDSCWHSATGTLHICFTHGAPGTAVPKCAIYIRHCSDAYDCIITVSMVTLLHCNVTLQVLFKCKRQGDHEHTAPGPVHLILVCII